MREYKFRGKRIDTSEWVYGYLLITQMSGVYIIGTKTKSKPHKIGGEIASVSIGDVVWQYEVDPDTVGQCTGLFDKNGKEIYEGDITAATYGKHYNEPKGLTRICKVIYDGKTCSFRMAVDNSKVLVSFGDSRSKDIEIIGNIHDNLDLLASNKLLC